MYENINKLLDEAKKKKGIKTDNELANEKWYKSQLQLESRTGLMLRGWIKGEF